MEIENVSSENLQPLPCLSLMSVWGTELYSLKGAGNSKLRMNPGLCALDKDKPSLESAPSDGALESSFRWSSAHLMIKNYILY